MGEVEDIHETSFGVENEAYDGDDGNKGGSKSANSGKTTVSIRSD